MLEPGGQRISAFAARVLVIGTIAAAAFALPPIAGAGELAPLSACRGQTAVAVDLHMQLGAMQCLINWARRSHGLQPLRGAPALGRSAKLKAADIVRCGRFTHTPCGESFARPFQRAGYLRANASVGENLAWGMGGLGSARSSLAAWLRSPAHRGNLFTSGWRDVGVALAGPGHLFGMNGVTLWVAQFGRR